MTPLDLCAIDTLLDDQIVGAICALDLHVT